MDEWGAKVRGIENLFQMVTGSEACVWSVCVLGGRNTFLQHTEGTCRRGLSSGVSPPPILLPFLISESSLHSIFQRVFASVILEKKSYCCCKWEMGTTATKNRDASGNIFKYTQKNKGQAKSSRPYFFLFKIEDDSVILLCEVPEEVKVIVTGSRMVVARLGEEKGALRNRS